MTTAIEHATLTAPDISCDHCVATINKALGGLAGVTQVETSAQTKQVKVAFDPARVSLTQIASVLDEEGYPVQM
jgi:copper ion binding protein